MKKYRCFNVVPIVVILFSCGLAFAACPSADLTGDCFVDFEDFAVIGAQWLNLYDLNDVNTLAIQWLTTDPCIPDDMIYILGGEFEMGYHFAEGAPDELPVHAVLLDAFFVSNCETTNLQYCDYLNSAYPALIKVVSGVVFASSDSTNSYRYCDTHSYDPDSQIEYSEGLFSVTTKEGRDMSNDPVVEVSWYGAVAYCNFKSGAEARESCYNLSTWEFDLSKHGYRLPTEAEWEYVARGGNNSPYYRFPWGDTISHSQANYFADPCNISYDVSTTTGFHPDSNDTYPYTSVVGSFSANGYGLYDIAGNVYEWCNDWYDSNYYNVSPYENPLGPLSGSERILRGGGWHSSAAYCRVAYRDSDSPGDRRNGLGFRVVLDLE